ncbi:BBSome-interacting protein 1 [Teleopsis dalmanni]|uniref:BBSome-interacting protein 1 n=1 Tax=Teleopsis dalmanni TaxID=139649 RepID=UPI0018CD235F|nr:BBSome-interacting protein 1 [Teleopsis dalmanni]
MSEEYFNRKFEKIDLIEPTTGKLFFEHKSELIFCKPQLMPIKSQALERLESMQFESAKELQKKILETNVVDSKNSTS